ncbi:BRO1 domain-containing protein BROX-like [Bacillus rossius redtenbacheri]|uniref:BRO1 domain-containing protein BROX-like n=1 Tax=Bacillus rossius redtenbacheri TaxID=93214 RepID=UPI002FDE40AD
MSHWFHRNVIKATSFVKFDSKMVAEDYEALKICSDLRESRQRLLELLPDPNHAPDAVESALNLYLALLHGFITSLDGGPSKLRGNFLFRWTHTLLGSSPEIQQDTVFEAANMCCNVALWHMKHAALIAAKDNLDMEEAKDVHKSLRRAAGVLGAVQKELLPQLRQPGAKAGDLDPRVAAAYLHQCTAEAQEVTVARAVELKHVASLVSALANETSKMFTEAAHSLQNVEQAVKWRKYLEIKSAFYQAYAYCYYGENLLSLDQCGDAIRALQESQASYKKAEELCREYGKLKGKGSSARPENHPFFRKLGPVVRLMLEKCERENGFIYHQKVPDDPPELEIKATYGLASPEEFHLPQPSPLWTPVTYSALDSAGPASAVSGAAAKAEGELPPVNEVKIPDATEEPKTESGCTLQ